MALWDGRFSKKTDKNLNDFNSSLAFDSLMYRQDIAGSAAHAAMLAACGVISGSDAETIISGLDGILRDIESGALTFDKKSDGETAEDIHTFIERELTERVGDAGKRLHTARSRNDQVATDLKLYLNDEALNIIELIKNLARIVREKAEKHAGAVMCGYTHMQRAQPIVLGHHLMAYAWMFLRDIGRLEDARRRMMAENPLGSCALAGASYPIDRFMTSKALGFDAPSRNSLDGVSDRDFCVEINAALAILTLHISRFAEEIIIWSSWEFKYMELDDAFATGSSIMPQKKNPDIAELARGKSGRVFGDLIASLTMLKGLPLAYNKDMQEDKEAIFDSIKTVKDCLSAFAPMLATATVLEENMRAAAARGFINATDCADYLTKKGVPFRDAYKITGQIVAECLKTNATLETFPLESYKAASPLFESDIYDTVSLDACVAARSSYGGASPESVKAQIAEFDNIFITRR
ncbi:MAG: argininosuccinate lyase [Clostridiales bacterium]|jgi:argininosuccinate lyase|nr:argininosuccinate lyase [Clostridiales bacterium]